MPRIKWRNYILPGIFLIILAVFVLYPTLTVAVESLDVDGQTGPGNYIDVFTKPHLFSTIWSSISVACAAAAISTIMGLTIAVVVFKTTLPLRRLLAVTAVLPMIIPGFVTALAFIFLFGRNGLITYQLLGITWDVYSWKSVLILQILDLTTTSFFLIAAVLVGVDSRVEDAARNLGASEWQVLRTITLPLLRPGIIGALLLTFMRSMSDFGTPLIVGGSFDTLASASYTQLIGTYSMEMAATLNMVLLLFCMLAFWLYTRGQASSIGVQMQVEGGERKPIDLSTPIKSTAWLVGALFGTVILMLLVSVFLAAFTKHIGGNFALTLEHFEILPQRGWNSTRNTLVFAAITSVVMSLSGVIVAYLVTRTAFRGRRVIDFLATLPFAIPGTFMGVGFALAFNKPPLLLSGTWAIVVAVTVIRELPLGVRAGVGVLVQQDRSVEDASATLGASRLFTFLRVVLPMARPALIVSALYAFVSTVQTLGAIIFLITPGTKLLSVDVFEAAVRDDVGDAAALSMIMLVLAALGAVAIFVLGRKGAGQPWLRRTLAGKPPA